MVKFSENERNILKKYTVDELDLLHDLVGLGKEWRASSNRADLVAIEAMEMELIQKIVEDIKIVPTSENVPDEGFSTDQEIR